MDEKIIEELKKVNPKLLENEKFMSFFDRCSKTAFPDRNRNWVEAKPKIMISEDGCMITIMSERIEPLENSAAVSLNSINLAPDGKMIITTREGYFDLTPEKYNQQDCKNTHFVYTISAIDSKGNQIANHCCTEDAHLDRNLGKSDYYSQLCSTRAHCPKFENLTFNHLFDEKLELGDAAFGTTRIDGMDRSMTTPGVQRKYCVINENKSAVPKTDYDVLYIGYNSEFPDRLEFFPINPNSSDMWKLGRNVDNSNSRFKSSRDVYITAATIINENSEMLDEERPKL